MNEPLATGGTSGTTTQPDDGGTGAGGEGEQQQSISTQDMVNQIAQMQAPDSESLTEEQMNNVRRDARDFIMDTREALEEEFPEATRGQQMAFAEAMLKVDPAGIIKAIRDAMQTSQEKADNDKRTNGQDLHVQGGGSGKPGSETANPKSMRHAVVNAANLFRS